MPVSLFTKPGDNFARRLELADLGLPPHTNTFNGDAWLAVTHPTSNHTLLAVLDGARSPYRGCLPEGMPSDVWAALRLSQLLKASFLRSSITNPRDLLAACIESYAASCRRLKAQATVAEEIDAGPKIWNPACAAIVVIVNLTEGTAQYVQLADCRLNYVMAGTTGLSGGYRNPYHNACKRNPVLGLNGYAQNVLYKGGITPNELLSVENTCIRHNRALLYNTQNGCAVFNGEPEMLEAPMAEGKLEGFTHLLLTSDGFEFPQLEVVVDNTLDLASVYKTFIEDDFTIKGTPVPFDATALLWQPRE